MFQRQQQQQKEMQYLAIGLLVGIVGAYYYFQSKACPDGYTKDATTGACIKTIDGGDGTDTDPKAVKKCGCGCGNGGVTIITNGLAGVRPKTKRVTLI